MRGAGCVYNDIVDADLDAKVARTRLRPVASGRVRAGRLGVAGRAVRSASSCCFSSSHGADRRAVSLALVAAYPFMKRITWWPQAWLGLVFTWGALVGWTAVRGPARGAGRALGGVDLLGVGYDTIYALQDKEDDALVGVRSSALALGRHARLGVAICYLVALGLWAVSLHLRAPRMVRLLGLLPIALHLLWQAVDLKPDDGDDALAKFRSNRTAGFLMLAGLLRGRQFSR